MLDFSRDELLEREMPLAVKTVSAQLAAGQSFEKAVQAACEGFGAASEEFNIALAAMQRGATARQAFETMASHCNSPVVKLACSQIVFAYEHGGGATALEQAASQMIAERQAKLKQFNSRASFLGIAFIAASCIAPALAAAYLVVGSAVLSITTTPLEAALLFLVAFPLVDFAILAFLYRLAPLESGLS